MDEHKKYSLSLFGGVFFFAIIGGSCAGIIASVTANRSLQTYMETLTHDDSLVTLSQVKPRPLPGTYEEALERVFDVAVPTLALVRTASVDTTRRDRFVHKDDVLGAGTVVTSDGWVLFHKEVFSSFSNPAIEADIWIADTRYKIEEIRFDELTDTVMVRVQARDLSPAPFGATQDVKSGALLFAVPGLDSITPTSLENANRPLSAPILPAESFGEVWDLTVSPEKPSAIFNSIGELVGFSGNDQVVPLHQVLGFVQGTLRNETSIRAGLGAYVVNVESFINIDDTLLSNQRTGALIVVQTGTGTAVLPRSPASVAGLREYDLIVAVDGNLIAGGVTLPELLVEHRVGDRVNVEYVRDGVRADVLIELGAFSELNY